MPKTYLDDDNDDRILEDGEHLRVAMSVLDAARRAQIVSECATRNRRGVDAHADLFADHQPGFLHRDHDLADSVEQARGEALQTMFPDDIARRLA